MTLNELKKEVLALTFETELDSSEAFVFAANRALCEIHGDIDRREFLKIYKRKLEYIERYEKLSHEGGSDFSISLSGKAFSLTASGVGKIILSDAARQEVIDFCGAATVIKRKVTGGEALLKFTGDFDYEIHNLASFGFLTGESDSDIPLFESFERVDVKSRDPLFLALLSAPKNGRGELIPGLRTEGGLLFIPREYEGEINLCYKRLPKEISKDATDAEIDISPECSHLLALRCAAYLLFDGNEGLAEYYLSLYNSALGALKLTMRKVTSESYSDVLGWA